MRISLVAVCMVIAAPLLSACGGTKSVPDSLKYTQEEPPVMPPPQRPCRNPDPSVGAPATSRCAVEVK
jgi:hypothetical protein